MAKRTALDVKRSFELNTYVMSCHLNRDDLYKSMKQDIEILLKEIDFLNKLNLM